MRILPSRDTTRLSAVLAVGLLAGAGGAAAAGGVIITSSKQVKAGALSASDLSASARKSLRGKTGPRGATGATGATGAAGAAGAPGATGPRGNSKAFEVFHDASFTTIPTGDYTTIATIQNLPAGSYLLNGQINAFKAGAAGLVNCRIKLGSLVGIHSETYIGNVAGSAIDNRAVVQLAGDLPAAGNAELQCVAEQSGVGSNGLSFTALQVDSSARTGV